MIKVIITGCNGAMGKNLVELIDAEAEMVVVAGVDRTNNALYDFPQFETFEDIDVEADLIIDFSHFSLMESMADFIETKKMPAVICTTGIEDKTQERFNALSKTVAIFQSRNMSLGINLLIDLVKKAAPILADAFDIEVVEKHHNKKVDAPSGTAFMIAEAMKDSIEDEKSFTYGREGRDAKREKSEIGIHAVRGGTIVGTHEVIFAGIDEVIEINHSATSKKVFAQGAIKAAKFLYNKPAGKYSMKDII